MQDLACPQCHKLTIPLWNRVVLGPARAISCGACGAKVSVPYSSFWTLIPIVVGVGGALWCRQIAWNFDLLRRTRFIYCAGVTLLCYGVLALVLTGLTHV